MIIADDTNLDQYEEEDIFDIIVKLETSFAIRFDKKAFINVKTFGELCDVIENYIKYDSKDGCTKQQAFYKIRTAITETQLLDKKIISLNSKLVDIFPRQNRRRKVQIFQKKLGVKLTFLTYPGWLSLIFLITFLASLVALFLNWYNAVWGIILVPIALHIADKLGNELAVKTIRELTEKAATEHYVDMRSTKLTVNRNEILDTIKEAFQHGLAIEKEKLTRDAKFSWA